LHIPQQLDDLDHQPGLLGYLADHCVSIGLASLYPAAGHRPPSPSRLMGPPYQKQPAHVIEDHRPDAPDPPLGYTCHQRSR
jgi:hypothetical protein